MNLRLPTRFVLLDKTIATLGAVGDRAVSRLQRVRGGAAVCARADGRALLAGAHRPRARREGWQLSQIGAELPYQLHDTLEQVRDGQMEVGFVHKGLDDLLAKLDTLFNRLVIALVVTGGLIGSSLIGIFAKTGPHVLGLHVISVSASFSRRCSACGCSGASSAPAASSAAPSAAAAEDLRRTIVQKDN